MYYQFIRFLFILLFLGSLAISSPRGVLLAQSPAINDVTINYMEAVADDAGVVTVSAYVSVSDREGQPISGLNRDNFTALEGGLPVEIQAVAPASDAIAIVLILDTSGSMASPGPDGMVAIDAAKQAAASFIDTLAPEDQIAVYSFSGEVTLLQDLTNDHNAAINAVNSLTYTDFGWTCLYDAAFEAVKKSVEVPRGRRAVIVLTDGVDEKSGDEPCSVHTFGDVKDEAVKSTTKVPIFTIGFGDQIDEQELYRLASLTGGHSLNAPNAADVSAMFNNISSQLKNQYLVRYQTTAVSGEHPVVIKVQANGSQGSGERRVFVPVPVVDTPETPTPEPTVAVVEEFSIRIVKPAPGEPIGEDNEIVVDLSQAGTVAETGLYIDNQLMQKAVSPPFDRFTINLSELGTGRHVIRIEAVNDNGVMAFDERQLEIKASQPIPESPEFAPESENASETDVESDASDTSLPENGSDTSLSDYFLYVILAIVLVLAILLGFVGWLIKRNRPTPTFSDTSSYSGTEDTDDPYKTDDPDATILPEDELKALPKAIMVILEGAEYVIGENPIPLTAATITIGRNTDKGFKNTIDIQHDSVSRRHAEIRYDGREFVIQDQKSTYGTLINGMKVDKFEPMHLENGAEILIGRKIKLKFNINSVSSYYTPTEEDDL